MLPKLDREQVVGVIDLRGGQAVRAVAGNRTTYQPLQLAGIKTGDAIELCRLYRSWGVGAIYIADLDAIVDRNDASLQVIKDILAETNLPLWLDRGVATRRELVRCLDQCESLIAQDGCKVTWVTPTERLQSEADFQQLVKYADQATDRFSNRIELALGIDLQAGTLNSPIAAWVDEGAHRLMAAAWQLGLRRAVVIDLPAVGTRAGATSAALCAELITAHPGLTLWAGGGVSCEADILRWCDAGCAGVLVATYLQSQLGNQSAAQRARDEKPGSTTSERLASQSFE